MSSYVGFTNKGEIPINAFKLLGASTKRDDDSKIGFFGSGLKYAFAVLLREEIDFKVYSGEKEIRIGKRATDFMGKKVFVVTVNSEKTSITIEAGIDWLPWFAIREIYSNALDEGGDIAIEDIKPEKGFTKIYIDSENTKFGDVFTNWKKYFATKRPTLSESKHGRLLEKLPMSPDILAYRRGILAFELSGPAGYNISLFDYDIFDLEINESRVAKYSHQVDEYGSNILASADIQYIRKFLKLSKNPEAEKYWEWRNAFWNYTNRFSKAWIEAVGDRYIVPYYNAGRYELTDKALILPDQLCKKLTQFFGKMIQTVDDDAQYRIVEDSEYIPALKKSGDRIASYGLSFDSSKLHIAKFTDKAQLGLTDEAGMFISEDVFKNSIPEIDIDAIVLEEVLHYVTGMSDFTRQFQSYLVKSLLLSQRRYYEDVVKKETEK